MEDIDTADITDPTDVARIAFGADDGVILGDITYQTYVDVENGDILADVYISDTNLEGGGAFRYRIAYAGPAPLPNDENTAP
ncbi:hypothetical protein [Prauserella endophytica]|uniref:Uncharacterized protein n=1 Tax=Prauserella endophytica TaxID=1592324 RepID=A0ABY2RUZ2_9PSEU|nr:hypothetical protein [Prauserella endophytica]TKG61549.1 hypothetical protein FCN18_33460 [Prauserella endophytica]